ncbi:UNVERIFIED_CONTAM: hypothetical protein GTU68_055074 [Idotea baltica]|nr:hypothetical protein [Idotea baltica]
MHAIKDLTLSLKSETFTCVIGPSGCGKTTTLRILLGLDQQFDGQVEFSPKHTMTAVFQEPRLLPWRTVEQNVRLALSSTNNAVSLDDLFIELGLDDVRQFYPAELSLGMARRAALARAFAVMPDLLILDEPFVSLDDATALRLRQLLLSLWKSTACTALMVTHNVEEAVMLADEVIVLSARPASQLSKLTLDVPQTERDSAYIKEMSHKLRQVGLVE